MKLTDIKMFNGSVDVLRYAQGRVAEKKTYYVKESRAYPTQITGMPNMVGDKVIMDKWYSYSSIFFRNIAGELQ
jgi:hypothetical protein